MPNDQSVDLGNQRELAIEGSAVPVQVNDYRPSRSAGCAYVDLSDGSVVAIRFRSNDHAIRVVQKTGQLPVLLERMLVLWPKRTVIGRSEGTGWVASRNLIEGAEEPACSAYSCPFYGRIGSLLQRGKTGSRPSGSSHLISSGVVGAVSDGPSAHRYRALLGAG
jgi:hypothetical protein